MEDSNKFSDMQREEKEVESRQKEFEQVFMEKNPGFAAILSFFWCGVGQIYNGNYFRGMLMALIYAFAVLGFLVSLLAIIFRERILPVAQYSLKTAWYYLFLFLASMVLMLLYSVTEAYTSAYRKNLSREKGKCPEEEKK